MFLVEKQRPTFMSRYMRQSSTHAHTLWTIWCLLLIIFPEDYHFIGTLGLWYDVLDANIDWRKSGIFVQSRIQDDEVIWKEWTDDRMANIFSLMMLTWPSRKWNLTTARYSVIVQFITLIRALELRLRSIWYYSLDIIKVLGQRETKWNVFCIMFLSFRRSNKL